MSGQDTGIIPGMETPNAFKPYLSSTLMLLLLGAGGLAAVLLFSVPYVWARWAFFVFVIMTLTGAALPAVYYLHQRFWPDTPLEAAVLIRQAMWAGLYGATLAWLQLGRLVTLNVILGLAGGMIAMEYFIRIREKANRVLPASHDVESS